MKFAKELEEDLVPEWRVKYFNYKLGKKKIKAVSRALRSANRSPADPDQPDLNRKNSSDQLPFTHYDFNLTRERSPRNSSTQARDSSQTQVNTSPAHTTPAHEAPADILRRRRESVTMFSRSPPVLMPKPEQSEPQIPEEDEGDQAEAEAEATDDSSSGSENHRSNEHTPLQERNPDGTEKHQRRRYGSIVGTPPEADSHFGQLAALNLPDPALDLSKKKTPSLRGPTLEQDSPEPDDLAKMDRTPTGADGYWDQQPDPKKTSKKFFRKRNSHRKDGALGSRAKLRRVFTSLALDSPAVTNVQFEAWKELDARQADFFGFLDRELAKIEKFYKQKEEEATARLNILREQLHEMRDRRLEDLTMSQNGKPEGGAPDTRVPVLTAPFVSNNNNIKVFLDPFSRILTQKGKIGKTSKAREELGSPRDPPANDRDRGDYVRKQQPYEKVPYRNAKRKLKLALQEFYRGLELLKSYALLNRTAFRKINKKYDKAVMARPPLRYMSEKVNNAHFVQSTLVEETLVNIEDLYARYFERGNRKVAVNKLRSHLRQEDQSAVSFRNGLFVALGSGFAISGLVSGIQRLYSEDPSLKIKASYLFQIYAGYFLSVLLFLLFVLDCRIWTRYRVNYTFVFEYDTRHVLDWRELAELPCFFLFLNGLFFWINFQVHHDQPFFVYWPVVLIGVTVIIIFLPFKIVYYHARKWWLYSNWRLVLAGLYPVEFRDFFLGDMYCSETYAMSQLEVFFCLYAHQWNRPQRCNSNHSRLLGFLTTLPAIWRSFQCLRRYYDSRNWFPHLANFVKYLCNVVYYMTLSIYRIHLTGQTKAIFITFALINGLYCAFWDIFMDFSLGNPWSKNFLLRDNLAFRRKKFYYAVMVVDFVLRQQWIAYAIFTDDLQHSAVTSFVVALAEVIRRGVWSLFRVENEHCNNVEAFRASRDLPLPYSVPESRAPSIDLSTQTNVESASPMSLRAGQPAPGHRGSDAAHSTATDPERLAPPSGGLRPRSKLFNPSTSGLTALQRVGTAIATAHAQDFEKKRRPDVLGSSAQLMGGSRQSWSDDDDDDDDDGPRDRRSTAIDINRERYLDSREDVRGRRSQDIQEISHENSHESSSASSSGDRHLPRNHHQRHERNIQNFHPADDGAINEVDEVRTRVNRNHGFSDPRS